nr:hypothetical protein CFP56_62749 [Quercus suber]
MLRSSTLVNSKEKDRGHGPEDDDGCAEGGAADDTGRKPFMLERSSDGQDGSNIISRCYGWSKQGVEREFEAEGVDRK